MKKPTLNKDSLPISDAINVIIINYVSALAEIEKLKKIADQLSREVKSLKIELGLKTNQATDLAEIIGRRFKKDKNEPKHYCAKA